MAGKMWMGLRGREKWVTAPATGMTYGAKRWSSKTTFLSGGANVRSSIAAHVEYEMSWNALSRDSARAIEDITSGIDGTGLVYFLDPMAMDKNVLPAQWAFPALAALDGPVLWGKTRPASVPTETNSRGYPTTSAQYRPSTTRSSLYIPIPPGHTAWVGFHGTAVGTGGLEVSPILPGGLVGDSVLPKILPVDTDTLVNTAFSGDIYRGIELRFGGGTAAAVTIAGMVVQILRSNATPKTGGFISGQGHSGCKFDEAPQRTAYSAAVGRGFDGMVSLSAKLTEIGDWT